MRPFIVPENNIQHITPATLVPFRRNEVNASTAYPPEVLLGRAFIVLSNKYPEATRLGDETRCPKSAAINHSTPSHPRSPTSRCTTRTSNNFPLPHPFPFFFLLRYIILAVVSLRLYTLFSLVFSLRFHLLVIRRQG